MKDRNGKELFVGDRVFVLPDKAVLRKGGIGYVRAIKDREARIDNGAKDAVSSCADRDDWTWSVWAMPSELESLRETEPAATAGEGK